MHSFCIVLVPQDTRDPKRIIEEWIAPYYMWLDVPDYKSFFTAEQTIELAKLHRTGDDLEHLATKLRKFGEKAGVEDGRVYLLSSYNSKARWDGWYFTDFCEVEPYNETTAEIGRKLGWDQKLYNQACLVSHLPDDIIPYAIVTSDEWHSLGDFGWKMMVPANVKQKAEEKWAAHMRNVLGQHQDHIALAIDVHS